MFRSILIRSVATTAAVGAMAASALVANPGVVATAPEIEQVACEEEYQGSIATTTLLNLQRYVAQFGKTNRVYVKVGSDEGQRTPTGRVVIRLRNSNGSVIRTYFRKLSGGDATARLPRRLKARRTYTVAAQYQPGCSKFARSNSGDVFYTVKRARTRTFVNAPNRRDGQRPRVNVSVNSGSGVNVPGKVRVVLFKEGRRVGRKWSRLTGGDTTVRFRPRRANGQFDVITYYVGHPNFRRSKGEGFFNQR